MRILEGGCVYWEEDAYPSESAPGHKLQKPSKEFGIFQSLGAISFVFFTKRHSQKGGHSVMLTPLNTLLFASEVF